MQYKIKHNRRHKESLHLQLDSWGKYRFKELTEIMGKNSNNNKDAGCHTQRWKNWKGFVLSKARRKTKRFGLCLSVPSSEAGSLSLSRAACCTHCESKLRKVLDKITWIFFEKKLMAWFTVEAMRLVNKRVYIKQPQAFNCCGNWGSFSLLLLIVSELHN